MLQRDFTKLRSICLPSLAMLGLAIAGFTIAQNFESVHAQDASSVTQGQSRRMETVLGTANTLAAPQYPGSQTQYSAPQYVPATLGIHPTLPGRLAQVSGIDRETADRMEKAMKRLQNEDSSNSEIEEAREVLSTELGNIFDADLEQRKSQIGQLEQQIETLKEQIEKRSDAKDRLVDLQIELLRNEAEGLGFPANWRRYPTSSFFTPAAAAAPTYYGPSTPLRTSNLDAPGINPPTPPEPEFQQKTSTRFTPSR